MPLRPPILPALVLLVALSGCAADTARPATDGSRPTTPAAVPGSPTGPSTPTPTASPTAGATPSTGPSGAVADLVALEGTWMCDIQRFTFDDLDAIQVELDTRLTSVGVTRGDYDAFRARLESEPALRDQVLDGYRASCDDTDSAEG